MGGVCSSSVGSTMQHAVNCSSPSMLALLRASAQIPPLHHCRRWGPFREGVVKRSAVGQGSWLDVGLDRDAHIPQVGLNQIS